jgi:hypothetical protein
MNVRGIAFREIAVAGMLCLLFSLPAWSQKSFADQRVPLWPEAKFSSQASLGYRFPSIAFGSAFGKRIDQPPEFQRRTAYSPDRAATTKNGQSLAMTASTFDFSTAPLGFPARPDHVLLWTSPLDRSSSVPPAARDDSPDLSSPVHASEGVRAQDFSETVLPITELKVFGLGVQAKFGTGFCLDPECRFIGTNYHAAMLAKPRKIKGEKVIQRYLATGPDDEDATVNDVHSVGPMKYTLARDLAIFELRHPLPNRRGVAFRLDELQTGQKVDIYAYPLEGINPVRSLRQFHGTFKGETTTGLLAFDYSLSGNGAIRPGASGGIVVDTKPSRS